MSYINIPSGGGTAGGIALAISGNTSGTLATISSGTVVLFGGNNITLSQNGQSITLSGGVGGGTLSFWEPNPLNMVTYQTRTLAQSSLYMFPLYVPANLSVTQWMNVLTLSVSTSSNSSAAAAVSQSVGIYTISGNTLNLLTASSGAANVQFTNTSNNSTGSIQGLRGFTVPLTMNATPGNYWIGIVAATASTNTNWISVSNLVVSLFNSSYSGQIGEAGAATRGVARGLGVYSVQTAALPATVGLAELTASQLLSVGFQYMNFAGI